MLSQAYGNQEIAEALAAQEAEEEREKAAAASRRAEKAVVAEEKESHPEAALFDESSSAANGEPRPWTALEDAALTSYVAAHQIDFDRDPRAGAFWRRAEKELASSVRRTWTQMKLHYLSDLQPAAEAARASRRDAQGALSKSGTISGRAALEKSGDRLRKLARDDKMTVGSVEESVLFGSDDEDDKPAPRKSPKVQQVWEGFVMKV